MAKRKLREVCYIGKHNDPKNWDVQAELSMMVDASNWDEWRQRLDAEVFEVGRALKRDGLRYGYADFISGRRVWPGWSNFVRCCDCCGTPYETPREAVKYCPKCGSGGAQKVQAAKRKAERQAALTPRPCQHCGNTFSPKRSDARYCSAKCRVYANRKANRSTKQMTNNSVAE